MHIINSDPHVQELYSDSRWATIVFANTRYSRPNLKYKLDFKTIKGKGKPLPLQIHVATGIIVCS